MPYDVLDAIERAAIRDKNSPVEVFELMRTKLGNFSPQQLGIWVERFGVVKCFHL
jgi:NAD+ synthase (glutamine-hydrolysing)